MQDNDRYSNTGTVWMDVTILDKGGVDVLRRMNFLEMVVVSFVVYFLKGLIWPNDELIMNVFTFLLILSFVNMIDETSKVALSKGALADLSKFGYSKSLGWKPNREYKKYLSKMSDEQLVAEFERLIDERIENNKLGEIHYLDYVGNPNGDKEDHRLWEYDWNNKDISSKLNYIRDNKSYRERIMESKKDA